MPWLSAQKVYTENELVKAYLRAGQFVHVREEEMRETLALVHGDGFRQRIKNRSEISAASSTLHHILTSAASDELLALSRRRCFPKLFFAQGATSLIVRNHGIFCCICLSVCYNPHWYCNSIFSRFFCPSALGIVSRTRKNNEYHEFCDITSVACADCYNSIESTKEFRATRSNDDIVFSSLAALAKLITKNKRFRDRLRESADDWRKYYQKRYAIRFDPRKLDHVKTPRHATIYQE
jgi:hypothetical protein